MPYKKLPPYVVRVDGLVEVTGKPLAHDPLPFKVNHVIEQDTSEDGSCQSTREVTVAAFAHRASAEAEAERLNSADVGRASTRYSGPDPDGKNSYAEP